MVFNVFAFPSVLDRLMGTNGHHVADATCPEELQQIQAEFPGQFLHFQNQDGIWFAFDQAEQAFSLPQAPSVFSDFKGKDLAWHLDYCRSLVTFCELFGLKFQTIGVHGSVPYVELVNEAGAYLGTLHQFTTFNSNQDQFVFSFDPSGLGLTDTRYLSGAGWMYKL